MKVIIVKNIANFNKIGEIVEVKDGFARNFLIPQGFALEVNPINIAKFEVIKQQKLKNEERRKKTFLELKEKIEKLPLTLTAQVKQGEEIYGSINAAQILKALEDEGIILEKGNLVLEEPIKKIGIYNLKITLYPEIEAKLRLWVVKK